MVIKARLEEDGTVVEIGRDGTEQPLALEVDWSKIDATTEADIAAQIAADDADALLDAAAYARRVRRRVGLSQTAFAKRIGVPVDTVRNWEQGKRLPRGPARALLRIIDRAPEMALQALDKNWPCPDAEHCRFALQTSTGTPDHWIAKPTGKGGGMRDINPAPRYQVRLNARRPEQSDIRSSRRHILSA